MKAFLLALSLLAPSACAAILPACTGSQISLATDGENGNFDGMSHSGTLLILRNISPNACTIPGFPVLTFRDVSKTPLLVTREVPRFMHPGPVVVPSIVAPGAEVTASLRWVSGDVYDHGVCVEPTTVSVAIGGQEITAPVSAHICGPDPSKITFTATRLISDPVYKPGRAALNPVHR